MFKLLKYLKPSGKICLTILVFFTLLQAVCDLTIPDFINNLANIAGGADTPSTDEVWKQAGLMIAFCAGVVLSTTTVGFLASFVGSQMSSMTRHELFKNVCNFSAREINKFSIPSLITRSTNDIVQVQTSIIFFFRLGIAAPLTVILGIVKASTGWWIFNGVLPTTSSAPTNIWLSLPIIVSIVLLAAFVTLILMWVFPKFGLIQSLTDRLNNVTREELNGVRVIRAFNAENFAEGKFKKVNGDTTKINIFTSKVMNSSFPAVFLLMNILILSIYWLGSYLAQKEMIDPGTILSSVALASIVFMSFLRLIMLFIVIPRALVSGKRINEVLNTKTSILYKKDAITLDKFESLEFKHVSFKYNDNSKYILNNISFKLNKGETLAFIGATGAGKTTIIELILRLYDVNSGQILINGIDIKDLSKDTIAKLIGYVPQKISLLSGKVKDNISFGSETLSDKELEWASEISEASFIKELKEKYNSHVAQGATNFSGGQKQRISIARAIAKKPNLLIFDDSFSALDYQTDAKVRSNIKKELSNSSKIIVAARVGTILDADKIVVLEKGKVSGIGKHKQLMKSCKTYKDIVLSQISAKEAAHG